MNLLKDKVAVITGATRGIGLSIATEFAKNGADIAFTYVSSSESAEKLEQELSKYGVRIKAYQIDASVFEKCQELVDKVLKDFGTIDILVNNAGITKDNLLMRISEEDFDKVINVNLKSVFNMVKTTQSVFLRKRSGTIINISSIVGLQGNAGQSNYAASKAGIIGFSKSIAKELGGRNIRCNVVAPGFISTEMTEKLDSKIIDSWIDKIPLKRPGKPQEVANVCLFLASELSSYVTGEVIVVDGGTILT